jgi:beta-glucosidase
MQVSAGEIYRLRIEYFDNVGEATVSFQAGMMDEERLASSLKHARNVIVCAGFNSSTEGEGFDRPFALSYGQEYLINKVASLHDNVAVVTNKNSI